MENTCVSLLSNSAFRINTLVLKEKEEEALVAATNQSASLEKNHLTTSEDSGK